MVEKIEFAMLNHVLSSLCSSDSGMVRMLQKNGYNLLGGSILPKDEAGATCQVSDSDAVGCTNILSAMTMYVSRSSNIDLVIDEVRNIIKDGCGDDTYVNSVKDRELIKVNYLGENNIQQAIRDPQSSEEGRGNALGIALGSIFGALALLLCCLGGHVFASRRNSVLRGSKSPPDEDDTNKDDSSRDPDDRSDDSSDDGIRNIGLAGADDLASSGSGDYDDGRFGNGGKWDRGLLNADSFHAPDINHPSELHCTQNVHVCASATCTECQNGSPTRFVTVHLNAHI